MQNLKTFFKNHFNTPQISDDKLKKFTEDHLQRLISNNGGGTFNALIADTTTAYQAYYGAISDEGSRHALQQAFTVAMNNTVEIFKAAVSQKEGIVKGTFGKESPAYQEFFPFGAGEYSHANLAEMQRLMDQFITAATAHVAELGAPFVTEFTNYKTAFLTARESQLLKKAEVTDLKSDSAVKRDVVEVQLMKNLLSIAVLYIGNEEMCNDFFDQSMIRRAQNGDDEENPTPPTP